MTVGQLKSRYREVFGENSRSNRFRQYLQRNSDVNDVVLRTPARESLAVPAFVSDSPADTATRGSVHRDVTQSSRSKSI